MHGTPGPDRRRRADLALTLRIVLERHGYEVVTAENGRRGLRCFFETRPDLVVLDIRMPELNGWETLERIRDLSDVPVLMLSGLSPSPRTSSGYGPASTRSARSRGTAPSWSASSTSSSPPPSEKSSRTASK